MKKTKNTINKAGHITTPLSNFSFTLGVLNTAALNMGIFKVFLTVCLSMVTFTRGTYSFAFFPLKKGS